MLHFADFALQEQLEDNLMVSISRAWYNGSYTMAAKPIKSLELHYTMVQFLIIIMHGAHVRFFACASLHFSRVLKNSRVLI